jgi:AraC-like DNA-binding protein
MHRLSPRAFEKSIQKTFKYIQYLTAKKPCDIISPGGIAMLSAVKINEIVGVNRLEHQRSRTTYRRDWENYALTIKKTGQTVYETDEGKKYVSDQNHMLLLRKGLSSLIHAGMGECITVEFSGVISDPLPDITSFYLSQKTFPINILEKMEGEWSFKRTSWQNSCMAGLYQLFAILEKTGFSDYLPLRSCRQLQPALEYIEKNYHDPDLDIETLAKKANMSTAYFRKIFKQMLKVSPIRYLQTVRIDKAKELLVTERFTINEASEMSGFSSPFYFDTVFKKKTGMTPTDYIRNMIDGPEERTPVSNIV